MSLKLSSRRGRRGTATHVAAVPALLLDPCLGALRSLLSALARGFLVDARCGGRLSGRRSGVRGTARPAALLHKFILRALARRGLHALGFLSCLVDARG
eukprot:797219-Prymnesium_polylepis.1